MVMRVCSGHKGVQWSRGCAVVMRVCSGHEGVQWS